MDRYNFFYIPAYYLNISVTHNERYKMRGDQKRNSKLFLNPKTLEILDLEDDTFGKGL